MHSFFKCDLRVIAITVSMTTLHAPTHAQTLDEVVISASRAQARSFDAPAAIQSVGRETIQNGGPQVNLSESLVRVPGLTILDRSNYAQDLQLSIRGFGARAAFGIRGIRLLIDGIPASTPDGQGQGSSVSLTSMDRIEVLRGPLAQLYGNASGGVIQAFTKPASKVPLVDYQYYVGDYGLHRADYQFSDTVGDYGLVADYSTFTIDGYRDNSRTERKQFNGKLDFNTNDQTTKNYVDLTAQGLDPKQSVKAATTANLASMSGPLTVDGISLVAGDRVLVKDQTTTSANGVYVVASGAWTRTLDMDEWVHLPGAYLFVEQGTVNADMGYLCTADQGGTLNTTAITFVQFNGAGQVIAGAGLTKTGNQLDVGTASSTRIVVNADNIDLATAGTSGTYQAVTTDAYGRVTSGTNPTTIAGYGITDAQPLDATLTALAGITTAADQVIYATGADTFSSAALPAFGRALIAALSASAARTVLVLGTIATQDASAVAITGGTIDGISFDGGTF